MKKNNKGFTLAELLIVVAIIAVLVAIAIPVFTTQLEKSRETTDMANIRAAYAAGTTLAMTDKDADGTWYYNPNEDGSLNSSTGTKLGQGTSTNGKADTSALPGNAQYDNSTDARGKQIEVTIANGVVTEIKFS